MTLGAKSETDLDKQNGCPHVAVYITEVYLIIILFLLIIQFIV